MNINTATIVGIRIIIIIVKINRRESFSTIETMIHNLPNLLKNSNDTNPMRLGLSWKEKKLKICR